MLILQKALQILIKNNIKIMNSDFTSKRYCLLMITKIMHVIVYSKVPNYINKHWMTMPLFSIKKPLFSHGYIQKVEKTFYLRDALY